LIEQELRQRRVPVVSLGRGANFGDLRDGTVNCWHVHGMLGDDELPIAGDGDIVLTESSYGDAYLRAGQDPLSVLFAKNFTALFVGFSFNDTYVRHVLLRASKSAGKPVAIGLIADESLVEKDRPVVRRTVEEFHQQLYRRGVTSGNAYTGAFKRVHIRDRAIESMPFWFSRWVLHSIGVEWWQVPSYDELPHALESLLPKETLNRRRQEEPLP
jgi:hypothetical protein